MTPASNSNGNGMAANATPDREQHDLTELARDLVDKVGFEGASRYCHGLGWLGVLDQVELLRHSRS